MPTVDELQARLDALRAARATGTLTIRTADARTVTYKSDKEMAAAIGDLLNQINEMTGATVTRFVRVGQTFGVE